jgi:hypothetical protein
MTSLRLFAALLASTLLISCNPFSREHIDSRNPTVVQQDATDVTWGLQPRKVRGNPKMRYQYNPRAEQAAAPSAAPAAPAPALAPAPAAPAAPPAPISTSIPSNLR